jgi:hypothetical protein
MVVFSRHKVANKQNQEIKRMKVIKPVRKVHSCTQVWEGTRDKVFPLLCPVKENDWTPGWDPKLVISNSGVIEQECLFVEEDTPSDAIWVVSKHDPDKFEVEMYRIVPEVIVGRFAVTLITEEVNTTIASISYEQTALSEAGEKIVNEFSAESFAEFMDEFSLAINHYLTTGMMIEGNELTKQEAKIHH